MSIVTITKTLRPPVRVTSAGGSRHVSTVHSHYTDDVQDVYDAKETLEFKSKKRRHDRLSGWMNRGLPQMEAWEATRRGDPMFFQDVEPKLARITSPIDHTAVARQVKRRRKRCQADFGNEVDIHAVRQGRIDTAWTRTKFENRDVHGNKVVHLLVNTSLSAAVAAADADWRTAAAIAAHDELVRMGKSVSVTVMYCTVGGFRSRGMRELDMMSARIKRSDQYMSRENLAAYLSASFHRITMMYKYMTSLPGLHPGFGYGYPVDTYELVPAPLHTLRDQGQHVVTIGTCFTEAQARELVAKVIQQVQDLDARPEAQTTRQMTETFAGGRG